jgi:probable phosphomutase (TIGR03848 family)
MATVVLLRHGRTTANATGVLAGRSSGVHLDERGREQARRAGLRLAKVPLAALISSPLVRCRETSSAVLAEQITTSGAVAVELDRRLIECDYGDWQGRPLKELAKEKLWSTVQQHPSAVEFPGGESMRVMQARAVNAVRAHDARLEAHHGPGAVWVAVSHGDLIKSILADALGMHLDHFQRINVDPASMSVVRFTPSRPFVLATNTHEGDLSWLAPPASKGRGRRRHPKDGAVGGGAGPEQN